MSAKARRRAPYVAFVIALLFAASVEPRFVAAQASDAVSFTELEPVVQADRVTVTARGIARADDGPLSAARHAARRRARTRALRMLTRWVDRAIARYAPTPLESQALQRALEAGLVEQDRSASVDGSVRIAYSVPLQSLRAAFDRPGLPWSGTP